MQVAGKRNQFRVKTGSNQKEKFKAEVGNKGIPDNLPGRDK